MTKLQRFFYIISLLYVFLILTSSALKCSIASKNTNTVDTVNTTEVNAISFSNLPVSPNTISVKSILSAMSRSDSASVIKSFNDLFYHTPSDSIPIKDNTKEVYATSFSDLPISPKAISVKSILSAMYQRDSTSIIKSFNDLLNPELFYYTPLDSIPINCKSDTLFVQITTTYNGGRDNIGGIKVWNKKSALSVGVVSFGYERKSGLRDWEQRLIEGWDVDSIRVLMNPTFYLHSSYPNPNYYVFQFIINHGTVKSRFMVYQYLYVPNDYKDDPIRRKLTKSY
ncbi:MAG: hypothetical protein K2L14_05430 [Duncaniella sp.]|nr:hypothetical protein [Duncaniella sp.]